MPRAATAHRWEFRARFRRNAFGWQSQPAIARVHEAVVEITDVARRDPVRGAEGAVIFLEKVSPALEHVDGSSGAMGTAVRHAIAALVPVIAAAPVGDAARQRWLERLFEAHARDEIPWIEDLTEYWGELCMSREVASAWAGRLLPRARQALRRTKERWDFFHGTSACLSALLAAERYDELLELLARERFWPYRRWAVEALIAQGRLDEALAMAEAGRGVGGSDGAIDRVCERILLAKGQADEAYRRYGLNANRANTYVAWYRAVKAKYPHKGAAEVLDDLMALTPGQEGKWFAAAKEAKLFEEAVALANRTPCDPRTLTRAARDFAKRNPAFAVEAGVAALRWLADGYGYEITGADVWRAYRHTMEAAGNAGAEAAVRERVAKVVREGKGARFVEEVLGEKLRAPDGGGRT